MTALAAGLFLLSVWLAVWSYLLYPAWVLRLAARRAPKVPRAGPDASVEVLVSAADEEDVIGDRVRDLLAQEYAGAYSVAIGCDGCTDRTAQRVREAAAGDARVRLVEYERRRGKASVLNDLVAQSRADLLVFTDANTRFDRGAVSALARALTDPGVGAACGRLVLETEDGGGTAETQYWERETRLKDAEGKLGVCLGANGAIYAARRASVEPLPSDTAMDDFLIPARIARRGEAVVFVESAVARELLPSGVRSEVSRRFRIGVGAGQVLRREPWLWSLRRPMLGFVFFSRKAARWLSPVALILAVAASLASPLLWPFGAVCLALAALLATGVVAQDSRLYYFGVMNVALAFGVLAGLFGYRRPAWRPVRSMD
jgi:cellulose synthase/poly-beta-1,6-N-acetylglucosamine synthase-like glycosyltransferase